jgi:signal transduction histidine kinase/NO-binding membrane sensor protein with MHYT domain/DNA-binding response OmpR family regulator
MNWYRDFFLVGQIPANAMHGEFNLKFVLLSYIIASIASYVALDLSPHFKNEKSKLFKICWWICGSIAMGAGIWSMHFIGMLAYKMDMPMSYDLFWTGMSMLVATVTAGLAFLLFMVKNPRPIHYILSGLILGIAIPTMHYTGMAGMNNVVIHYQTSIFWLSVLIAATAATAALWLVVHSDKGNYMQRMRLKIGSALIMGVAIAGMHYTGMAAAVITPSTTMVAGIAVDPVLMAILISTIVLCIMSIALILSSTKYYVTTRQNEKNFLEVVLNNLRGGVIAFDADKRLKLYNQATKNLFEHIDQLKDSSDNIDACLPLLQVNSKTPFAKEDNPLELIYKGQKIKNLEAMVLNDEGKPRILSIDGQLLDGQFGEKLGAVVVYQDITERKEIDQMKNEFISTVSHELRTPLTSIRGSLGLVMGGGMGAVPKEIAGLLEIACNNSERLVRLINDILDTEKIESGKMIFHFARCDLSKLITQAVVDNKAYADKYQVKYEIKGILPDVQALIDPDRVRQVLDNLLSNAAKFSKKDGVVNITMERNEGKIRVAVSDNGSGIPQEFQSRIFSKFYQADSSDVREKGGTGLGLSICKSIIEAHSGSIWFESKSKVGTTFYFELLEAKVENDKDTEALDFSSSQRKILICEDEADISKLLGLILKERGFSSVRVASIAEAKKALENHEFCLMTLDLMLPDGNGLELLKWMREKPTLEKLPVVVISAISIEQEKIKGSALGVVDWINKPINEDRLYKDVAQVLGTSSQGNKPRVLHVEDDPDIAKIVAAVLADVCYTDVSPTVASAKTLLTNIKYDLIILDLNLKDGSGYKVLTYLEESGYRIPVVILSVDEPELNVSKNIVASMVKSRVSNNDLLDKIVSIIESNEAKQGATEK